MLTKKQLEIFSCISNYQNKTFSGLVRELSKNYPQSTLKHILRYLKEVGLIEFENGKPIRLSELGRLAGGGNG